MHWLYLCGLLLVLLALSPYITSLLIACFLAYVLIIPVEFFRRYLKIPKLISVTAILILLLWGVGYAAMVFLPRMLDEVRRWVIYLPGLLENIDHWLTQRFDVAQHIPSLRQTYETWSASSKTLWGLTELSTSFHSIAQGSAVAFSTLFSFILIPVFVILLYAYHAQIGELLLRAVPEHLKADAKTFVKVSHRVMLHYFRGLGLVMLTLAVMYSISLTLFGIRNSLAIGIFSGCVIFIPYVGILVSALVALMSASIYFEHWTQILGVGISYATFPLIDNFFLSPTFIGVSIGMPPGLVLILLLIGGTWFGVLGAVFAIPIALLIQVAWHLKTRPEKLRPFLDGSK